MNTDSKARQNVANSTDSDLIPVESVNALELFTDEKRLDDLLAMIETEASGHVPNLSTAKGRKEIASLAYKVSQSKTTIDSAGKNLVADWKAKAKAVDQGRKKAREFLDDLRDRTRKPLNDWEAEQERIAEEKRLQAEIETAHAAALDLNELFDREAKIRAREDAVRKAEQEQAAKEQAEQEERQRAEREAQAKAEAEKRAQDIAERKIREEREKEKRLREKREADEANQKRIYTDIYNDLIRIGLSDRDAKVVLKQIISGSLPHVFIQY